MTHRDGSPPDVDGSAAIASQPEIENESDVNTLVQASPQPAVHVAPEPDVAKSAEVGDDVIGSCGHKIGEVVSLEDGYVVVEKGFFIPRDFYIPDRAIHRRDEHGVFLNVSKDQALHCGWDVEPTTPR